jgi:hypothetical protein
MTIFQIVFAIVVFAFLFSVPVVIGVMMWAGLREEEDDIDDDPRV